MIGPHLRRDLARAACRSFVFFVVVFSLVVAYRANPFRLQDLALSISVALVPFPLSLLEFHRARLPRKRRGAPFLVMWIVGFAALVLCALQNIYWQAGGMEQLGAVWSDAKRLFRDEDLLLANAALASCLCLVSLGRVPEEPSPIGSSLKGAALLGVLTLPLAGCFGWFAMLSAVLALGVLYSVGDTIEAQIWSWSHRDQARVLRDLPGGRLWLLAYAGHEPARSAMGHNAPVPTDDLQEWITGLGMGGEPIQHSALSLLHLVAPLWEEQNPDQTLAQDLVARLVEHMQEPTEGSRDAAISAMDAWRDTGWESQVAAHVVEAVTASTQWGTTTARASTASAAALVDESCGQGAARQAISQAIIRWVLEDSTYPGRGSATDPTPPRP